MFIITLYDASSPKRDSKSDTDSLSTFFDLAISLNQAVLNSHYDELIIKWSECQILLEIVPVGGRMPKSNEVGISSRSEENRLYFWIINDASNYE